MAIYTQCFVTILVYVTIIQTVDTIPLNEVLFTSANLHPQWILIPDNQTENYFPMLSPNFQAKWNITSKHRPRVNVNQPLVTRSTEHPSELELTPENDPTNEQNQLPSSPLTTTTTSTATTKTTTTTTIKITITKTKTTTTSTRNKPALNNPPYQQSEKSTYDPSSSTRNLPKLDILTENQGKSVNTTEHTTSSTRNQPELNILSKSQEQSESSTDYPTTFFRNQPKLNNPSGNQERYESITDNPITFRRNQPNSNIPIKNHGQSEDTTTTTITTSNRNQHKFTTPTENNEQSESSTDYATDLTSTQPELKIPTENQGQSENETNYPTTFTRNQPQLIIPPENQEQSESATENPSKQNPIRKLVVKHRTTTEKIDHHSTSVKNEANFTGTTNNDIISDIVPADFSHWEVVANVS